MRLTRALAAGWIAVALQVMPAQACRAPQFEHSIILTDLNGIDAPVAMQVTITKMIREEFVNRAFTRRRSSTPNVTRWSVSLAYRR